MLNWDLTFFSTSELVNPNMKKKLGLIRSRPKFYMISDNPKSSLEIVDCSLSNRRIALKDDYQISNWTCLHIALWSSTV